MASYYYTTPKSGENNLTHVSMLKFNVILVDIYQSPIKFIIYAKLVLAKFLSCSYML